MRFSPTLIGLCAALAVSFGLAPGAAEAAGGGKATHSEGSDSPYFAVPPMPVSIIHKGRGGGLLVVEIGLDAQSIDDRAYVEHLLPRLRDLYVQVLNLYASRDLKPDRPPNVDIIGARLQAATDQIVGEKYHARVLLRQVIVRPNQNK